MCLTFTVYPTFTKKKLPRSCRLQRITRYRQEVFITNRYLESTFWGVSSILSQVVIRWAGVMIKITIGVSCPPNNSRNCCSRSNRPLPLSCPSPIWMFYPNLRESYTIRPSQLDFSLTLLGYTTFWPPLILEIERWRLLQVVKGLWKYRLRFFFFFFKNLFSLFAKFELKSRIQATLGPHQLWVMLPPPYQLYS